MEPVEPVLYVPENSATNPLLISTHMVIHVVNLLSRDTKQHIIENYPIQKRCYVDSVTKSNLEDFKQKNYIFS